MGMLAKQTWAMMEDGAEVMGRAMSHSSEVLKMRGRNKFNTSTIHLLFWLSLLFPSSLYYLSYLATEWPRQDTTVQVLRWYRSTRDLGEAQSSQ